MYLNSKSIQGDKTSSIINYSNGSVTINVSKINVNWNSYTKRDKIYDTKTNLWTDTRPIYINNLSKSISVYVPKNIIKFTSTSYPEPKVIIELCNANEQRLNDSQEYAYADKKNNNKNNTASPPSLRSSALLCYPQRG
jgi:hypothetical protein